LFVLVVRASLITFIHSLLIARGMMYAVSRPPSQHHKQQARQI
jgi:hypothetical protein